MLGVGAYGPNPGTLPMEEHREWLRTTVEVTIATASHHGITNVWLCGDMNLRDVAPGPSSPAKIGTATANLAAYFKELLAQVGWAAMHSPSTHVLGGALDIHITNCRPASTVRVAESIPHCKSDHYLTHVCANYAAKESGPIEQARDARGVMVFEWLRDDRRWQQALSQDTDVASSIAHCNRAAAAHFVAHPPRKHVRRAVVTATQALADTLLCFTGSGAGLLRQQSAFHRLGKQLSGHHTAANYMLQTAHNAFQELQALAATRIGDAVFERAVRVQRNWLAIMESAVVMLRPVLHASWLRAASQGEQALQTWFSRRARPMKHRLRTRSVADANAIIEFWARVSRLDRRCDATADAGASARMLAELSRRCRRLASAKDPAVVVAGSAEELSASRYPALFVSTATIARFIRRRKSSKASSTLPWAAFRAASSDEAWLALVHSSLELNFSTADIDDASLAIEIEHAFKGHGKLVTDKEAQRPLGIAHPMTSLRSDILKLRAAPGLARTAGITQLGGIRDPRMMVIAKQEAIHRRRAMGLPSASLSCDVKFGFDAGRHARFMMNATVSGASDRCWLLLHRLLTGHKLHIRDITDEGCVALLPAVPQGGGGTIQGLSVSGPLFGPLPTACMDWALQRIPPACTSVSPEILEAYHRSKTLVPDGYWSADPQAAQAAAWAIEKALESADASIRPQALTEVCVEWLGALSTDAERLLCLDLLGDNAGSANIFVDDLLRTQSSPWGLKQAGLGISAGATHYGVCFEGGPEGKAVAMLDNLPPTTADDAELRLGLIMQGSTAKVCTVHKLLGVPDATNADCGHDPEGANRASRLPILRKVGESAAIGLRNAVGLASECPWPLLARRFYLSRLDAKIAFLTPLTIGAHTAGFRLTGIQSKWALAAVTGRTNWTRTLRVPSPIRQLLCADLGWPCIWISARASAIALLSSCEADLPELQHTQLANDVQHHAPGGWMESVAKLRGKLEIEKWQPDSAIGSMARKRALARYRREIVIPALLKLGGATRTVRTGPLPWLWLAANGGCLFPCRAFDCWWQLRTLGNTHPASSCPWCCPATHASRDHFMQSCPTFAERCWTSGVQPEEAFYFPHDDQWFTATLKAIAPVAGT